jgi:bifunctional ADP-heptose synthase (sugar kinase/adenylyltransferase)
VFAEDTPRDLIAVLEPDVLAKGADYAVDQIVGADLVTARGGRVVRVPLEEGYSTTNLLKKVNRGQT